MGSLHFKRKPLDGYAKEEPRKALPAPVGEGQGWG